MEFWIPGTHRGRLLVILAIGLVALLPGSWTLPLIDRDEPRFAEASREMIERGDYIVPFFNNTYRFDKPPLIYWLQVGAYRVLGTHDFAARLPSLLCTLLTALVIYGFAWRLRRLHSPQSAGRFAWMAAVIYLTALQTMIHGRAAVADAAMVLFVTLALWAGWECLQRPLPRRAWAPFDDLWWWLFTLSLALGFLAKGPVAWLPVVPLAVAAWQLGGWQRFARTGLLAALVLALAFTGIWGIPALIATGGEFFSIGIGKHVVERSISAMEGHGARNALGYLLTLPLYLPVVFLFFAPWSFWLPSLWQERAGRNWMGYLWWWVLTVFVVFSLIKTKLPHYVLPAYPALALLLARHFNRGTLSLPSWPRVRLALLAALAFSLLLGLVAAPVLDRLLISRRLGREIGPALGPTQSFAVTSYGEPSLVWYLRAHTRGWLQSVWLNPTIVTRNESAVILPKEEFAQTYPNGVGHAEVIEIQGLNPAKGRWMTLVVVLPRPTPADATP